MAHQLDKEKVERCLPKAFKSAKWNYQGKDVEVNDLHILSHTFSEISDLQYNVSGVIRVSISFKEDEIEDVYSFSTKINVNLDDKIEKCDMIFITKHY